MREASSYPNEPLLFSGFVAQRLQLSPDCLFSRGFRKWDRQFSVVTDLMSVSRPGSEDTHADRYETISAKTKTEMVAGPTAT